MSINKRACRVTKSYDKVLRFSREIGKRPIAFLKKNRLMDQVQPCTIVRVTTPYVIQNTIDCDSLEVLHQRKFAFLLIPSFVF